MGGASVPSSTSQFQQVATGIWGSPQATKLALPILKPALANIKNQQDMLMGFQKGDPAQTRKFLGLPEGASSEETLTALNRANNPVTSQVQYQPPAKTAAHGGIMSLEDEPARDPRRGFADGGTAKSLTPAQRQAVLKINKALEAGTITDAQKAQLDKIEKNTGLNVSPYSDTGTGTPKNPAVAKSVASANTAYQKSPAGQEKTALQTAAQKEGLTAADAYLNQAGKFGFDPTAYAEAIKRGDLAGVTTNPLYSQAIRQLQSMEKQPEQFGQATQAYKDAMTGLNRAASYSADKVTTDPYAAARMNAPTQAEVRDYEAAQMAAASMQAAQANRGDIRDIKAIQADVDKYKAAGMQAPLALQAEAYQAAQMQGAQLQGPKSWTDEGTAQKYMSPYQQNVTDIAKRESMRDFGKQLAQLRSQATGQKAFGGTRAALQESEARRGQAQRMSDIEAQGLNEAYKSGMGQFSAEQGLGLQAGQSNLQAALTTQQQNQAATNAQRQMYVQQALDAAKTSYGGELTAAQQNQIAQNAAAQFNSQSQNTAYNNYVQQQLAAQQANQAMDWNAVNLNTQNQQAANMTNAQLQQQANQANQAATNQQRSQYVNNALQAAMQAYGGQLTAEQQNQAAANAAAQFNAQQNLQGQQLNQAAGLQANQQNIGAYGQLGNMGQGLGALGSQIGNYNSNLVGMYGNAGGTLQGLGSNWYNQQTQNAGSIWGGPTALGNQGMGVLGGMGGGQQGVVSQATQQGK
jgi:hypothetical protein